MKRFKQVFNIISLPIVIPLYTIIIINFIILFISTETIKNCLSRNTGELWIWELLP